MTIKILLVDDQAVSRDALREVLTSVEGMEVVGEVDSGEKAQEIVYHLRPDVVIMDVALPGISGFEATRRILGDAPETRVIGVSLQTDVSTRIRMERAGAAAFVAKEQACEELPAAILAATSPRD